MKRYLVMILIVIVCCAGACLADGYDLTNMTTQQLNELKGNINKELDANHDATSSEESRVESAVKTFVEDYYGANNVSWAWFDYTYTKEWDYFTMSTHADVKRGNETSRCDIMADVFRLNDEFKIVYLIVGNEEIIDARNEIITDRRVRAMLNLSASPEKGSTSDAVSEVPSTDNDMNNRGNETEGTEDPVIAKLGDKNDTVKEIQNMLIRLNYLNSKADGDYGNRTKAAVISFQSDYGLKQTGDVTQEVYIALKNASDSIPETVSYARYTAKEVYSKYESNEIAADSEFKGKTIEVTGKVNKIGTSLFGNPYVDMKADTYGFNLLQFDFSKNDLDKLATLKEDQTITIRAKCTGWSVMFVYFDDGEIVG